VKPPSTFLVSYLRDELCPNLQAIDSLLPAAIPADIPAYPSYDLLKPVVAFQSTWSASSSETKWVTFLDEGLVEISRFEVDIFELEFMLEPRSHLADDTLCVAACLGSLTIVQ